MKDVSRPHPALLAAIALSAAASGSLLGERAAHAYQDCEPTGCGTNTPIIFGSPIVGLSTVGLANNRGITLLPAMTRALPSTAINPCPDGALIGVQNGELVGRWQGNTCRREGLIGMVISMKIPMEPCGQPLPHIAPVPCGEAATVRVRVARVSTVKTWAVDGQETLVSYQLVWHELPPPSAEYTEELVLGRSICPLTTGWMDEWQTTTMPINGSGSGVVDPRWKEPTDQLVIVQGETYSDDAAIDTGRQAPTWLNLACVGSALAKSRMLANNPMGPEAWEIRQSTLKMLTGRYLGAKSFTRRGIPLSYQRRDGKLFYGSPDPARVSIEMEAHWTANGARCVSHRRTWLQGTVETGESVLQAFWRWLASAQPEDETIGNPPAPLPPNIPLIHLYKTSEEPSLSWLRPGISQCAAAQLGDLWTTRPVDHVVH